MKITKSTKHVKRLAARQAAESPGRAGWQMSQQIAAAERSLAEVSADEIVESVLIAVANIPINPALRGDLVYIKDVYAAIRALKGKFPLRTGEDLSSRIRNAEQAKLNCSLYKLQGLLNSSLQCVNELTGRTK